MTSAAGWFTPPARGGLGVEEAAVWRLSPATAAPIESVAARYLGTSPESVCIVRSPTGKPELEGSNLAVSLAHSGDVVVVAVAQAEVGVDVEVFRPAAAAWALVDHALTERERRRLDALAAPRRAEAFLGVWARKEAILKAAGMGLGLDPQRIELDGLDVVAVPRQLGQADDWTLADVPLVGHTGAVALRGRLSSLLLFDARG